jgi:succinate dehydrogenase / fumarate reductase cytochrome b subunit
MARFGLRGSSRARPARSSRARPARPCMSTASSSASSTSRPAVRPDQARSSFFQSRLASLLGVVPLGVWTIAHVWHNLSAFQGKQAWETEVTEYPHPVAQAMTAIVVLLPLAIHAVWGIARMTTSRPNNTQYAFYGNLKYLLQRLSAIGLLLFLGAHLWLALLHPRLVQGHAEVFEDIAQEMHFHTPTLVVYILGTLAVSYHLANGVQSFCMTWGIVSSQRGLKRMEGAVLGFFVVLLAMCWAAVYALYAAGAPALVP